MSALLLIHLAQNVAVLELTEYTDPNTGKSRRLKDTGGTWLKVAIAHCNFAQEPDRYSTAGWRALAKAAGTNTELATKWTLTLEQIGWLTKREPVRSEGGRRGKPANCWEVTLPNLPPKVLELWQEPAKQKQAETAAPVKPISEAHSKRSRRSSAPVALGQVVGSVVQEAQPAAEVVVLPSPAWSAETLQAAERAKQLLLQKGLAEGLSVPKQLMLVAQAEGGWTARYGRQPVCPLQQVQQALAAGSCTDTEAVRYLASGASHKLSLQQFQTQGQAF